LPTSRHTLPTTGVPVFKENIDGIDVEFDVTGKWNVTE
jgi:hypothetical protein